jgi:nucleoside-diphosphate-sugar epimerase
MIIGITGHTRGIGRSLSDIFQKNNHHVIGFSKSTGFDIGNSEARKKILDQAANFDVFVNNAYHPTGQIEILKEILDLWKDTNNIVINISSQIVHKPIPEYDQTQPLACGNCNFQFCVHCAGISYKRSKTELNDYVNNYTGSVRILNVIVDITDTDFYLIPKNWDRSKFTDPRDLANLIFDVIKYSEKFFIKELNVNGNFKDRF